MSCPECIQWHNVVTVVLKLFITKKEDFFITRWVKKPIQKKITHPDFWRHKSFVQQGSLFQNFYVVVPDDRFIKWGNQTLACSDLYKYTGNIYILLGFFKIQRYKSRFTFNDKNVNFTYVLSRIYPMTRVIWFFIPITKICPNQSQRPFPRYQHEQPVCDYCGVTGHLANRCWFKGPVTCYKCGIQGHKAARRTRELAKKKMPAVHTYLQQ